MHSDPGQHPLILPPLETFLPFLLFLAALSPAAGFSLTASSWISGSGDSDYVSGVAIQSNGLLVVGGHLGDYQPQEVVTRHDNSATEDSAGAVLQLSPDGTRLLSHVRVADTILDLALDAEDNIYLAAGEAGIIKLDPDLNGVLWTAPAGGYCRRLAVGKDGTVIGLNNRGYDTGTCHLYDSSGNELASFDGWRRTQDVAIDSDRKLVFQTGYKNNHSGCNPVQIAYLRGLNYSGTESWRNYDWEGTYLDNCDGDGWDNLMADTRGYRVVVGGDGKLHAAFEVAGGNHILSREPAHGEPGNLKERIEIVGGDMWFEWYNTASEHKTFIGRYEPETGSYLQGQQICTRFWNGSSSQGNALRIDNGALAADQAGRVYFGGESASGLPFHPTHATSDQQYATHTGEVAFNPFPMTSEANVYSGGAFLIVLSGDFTQRLYCTRLSAGFTGAIDARWLPGRSEASLVWGGKVGGLNMDWRDSNRVEQILHTVNPVQPDRAGGSSDGFLARVRQ